MERRTSILFILPSLMRAGAETQVIELLNGLPDSQFSKYLLCFEKRVDLLPRLNQQEVVFFHFPRAGKFDQRVIRKIAAVIDEHDIEIIHCTLQISLFYGVLGKFLSRRKPSIVLGVHTTQNRDRKADFYDFAVYQWLMRACKMIIFVCDAQKAHWCKRFPFIKKRCSRIYNGINEQAFSAFESQALGIELRANLNIPGSAFVFGCIAAMRPEKGHLILLEAFSRLLKEGANARLVLAGDGVLRPEIEAAITKKGLSKCVFLLGSVADVRGVLSAVNCSVLASTAVETFSLAMLESLAMGVPVIATDIGGAAEAVIPGRTGTLVRPGDADDLLRAMKEMMEAGPYIDEIGKNATQLVHQAFSAKAMIDNTGRLLANIATR